MLTGCCEQPVNLTHDYTNCCLYRVDPPDDEQQACSKHVEVYYWNKLIESGYITTVNKTLNVKFHFNQIYFLPHVPQIFFRSVSFLTKSMYTPGQKKTEGLRGLIYSWTFCVCLWAFILSAETTRAHAINGRGERKEVTFVLVRLLKLSFQLGKSMNK